MNKKEKDEIIEFAKKQAKEQDEKRKQENNQDKHEIEDFDTDDVFTNKQDENEAKMEGENLSEIIKAWLDDKYVHAKTRLNSNQIVALKILKTLAEKYNVKCISELITNFVRYKLSEGGKSSQELVDILKSRTEVETDNSIEEAIKPVLK